MLDLLLYFPLPFREFMFLQIYRWGNKGPESLSKFLDVKHLESVRSEYLIFNSHEISMTNFFNSPISTSLTMNTYICTVSEMEEKWYKLR